MRCSILPAVGASTTLVGRSCDCTSRLAVERYKVGRRKGRDRGRDRDRDERPDQPVAALPHDRREVVEEPPDPAAALAGIDIIHQRTLPKRLRINSEPPMSAFGSGPAKVYLRAARLTPADSRVLILRSNEPATRIEVLPAGADLRRPHRSSTNDDRGLDLIAGAQPTGIIGRKARGASARCRCAALCVRRATRPQNRSYSRLRQSDASSARSVEFDCRPARRNRARSGQSRSRRQAASARQAAGRRSVADRRTVIERPCV